MSWWPGWNSIDGAHLWHEIFWWAGILCLAGLIGSEIIAKRYSTRKDDLVAQQSQQQEDYRKAEADALQMQLSEADRKVADLQAQQIARRLSAEQRSALIEAISPFAGQKIAIWGLANTFDVSRFATDFLEVFKTAKWEVSEPVRFGFIIGGDLAGVEVRINDAITDLAKVPPGIAALTVALAQLGLMPSANIGQDKEVSLNEPLLKIGRIPPKTR